MTQALLESNYIFFRKGQVLEDGTEHAECSEYNDCLLVKVILKDKFVNGKGTKRNTVVSKSLLACFSLQSF